MDADWLRKRFEPSNIEPPLDLRLQDALVSIRARRALRAATGEESGRRPPTPVSRAASGMPGPASRGIANQGAALAGDPTFAVIWSADDCQPWGLPSGAARGGRKAAIAQPARRLIRLGSLSCARRTTQDRPVPQVQAPARQYRSPWRPLGQPESSHPPSRQASSTRRDGFSSAS